MRGKHIVWTWIIALLLASLATAGISISPTATVVAIEPPTNTGAVGSTFKVDVKVYAVTDLYAWNVRVTFDPSVINVQSIERGPFLETAGLTQWQIWPYPEYGVIDNVIGYVIVGDTLMPPFPPSGASGDGVLLKITFKVMVMGVSPIHFDESKLTRVTPSGSVPITHEAIDGLFDNRVENALPTAVIYNPPLSGVVGIPLTFTSASFDPDGWLISEEWDFGDGENATGSVVEHAFAAAGTYTVTLTVADNDLATDMATADVVIQIWMEGGWMPDLVGWYAKPEHPDLNEAYGDRHLAILGQVGNPAEEEYEVYVEFQLFSKDEVKLLGYLCTDVYTIGAGEKVTLSADFDTANSQWRAFSGGYWVIYGYVHYFMHKYIGFARCYSRPVGTEDWTVGYVTKYLSFHVKSVRHDIGILEMSVSDVIVNRTLGERYVDINLNVTNEGAMDETFTVPVTTGSDILGEPEVTLAPGESQLLTITWDTDGFDLGVYVVKAKLPVLTYERDTTDQGDYCVVFIVE